MQGCAQTAIPLREHTPLSFLYIISYHLDHIPPTMFVIGIIISGKKKYFKKACLTFLSKDVGNQQTSIYK